MKTLKPWRSPKSFLAARLTQSVNLSLSQLEDDVGIEGDMLSGPPTSFRLSYAYAHAAARAPRPSGRHGTYGRVWRK